MTKVLVIDDEEGIRDILDTILRRKGYDVVLADGGRKGLELGELGQNSVPGIDDHRLSATGALLRLHPADLPACDSEISDMRDVLFRPRIQHDPVIRHSCRELIRFATFNWKRIERPGIRLPSRLLQLGPGPG